MTTEKKLDTVVTSKMDLTVNKEDVLEVLMAEQEEVYKEELALTRQAIRALTDTRENAALKIKKLIAKQGGVNVEDLTDSKVVIKRTYGTDTYIIEKYDLERLEKLKRPDLARDKMKAIAHHDSYVKENVTASRFMKTDDGFTGTLNKTFEAVETPEVQKHLRAYNEDLKKERRLYAEESAILYKILIMEHDKKIKTQFIKSIVKTSDYSAMLLSAGKTK